MQGIEFETDQVSSGVSYENNASKASWSVKLVMMFGIKDSTTANFIILGIIAILFGVAIFLYAGILSNSSVVPSLPPDMTPYKKI